MPLAWFLSPYKRDRTARSPTRYCAMQDFTEELRALGGDWQEADQGPDAIVLVRATDVLLRRLALVFRRLSETEARAAWASTRPYPSYDRTSDAITFTAARRSARTLESLVATMPERTPSGELLGLWAAWAAVGFGAGWRLPKDVVSWAVNQGWEPDRYGQALSYLFDLHGRDWATIYETLIYTGGRFIAGGAFPTTGVLDDFAGTGALSANWTQGDLTAGTTLERVSGAVENEGGDQSQASARWNVETFGPNSEVFMDVLTRPGENGDRANVALRVVQPGSSTYEAYMLSLRKDAGIFEYILMEVANGVKAELGARVPVTFLAADSMGTDAIGTGTNNLNGYRKTSGAWGSSLIARSDPTLTAAGYIAMDDMEQLGDAPRVDNFGGGAVVGAAAEVPQILQAVYRGVETL